MGIKSGESMATPAESAPSSNNIPGKAYNSGAIIAGVADNVELGRIPIPDLSIYGEILAIRAWALFQQITNDAGASNALAGPTPIDVYLDSEDPPVLVNAGELPDQAYASPQEYQPGDLLMPPLDIKAKVLAAEVGDELIIQLTGAVTEDGANMTLVMVQVGLTIVSR